MTTGGIYRINEETGIQFACNTRGDKKRPVSPKITGRFNYEERKTLEKRINTDHVRAPASLHTATNKIYAPSPNLLNGYA